MVFPVFPELSDPGRIVLLEVFMEQFSFPSCRVISFCSDDPIKHILSDPAGMIQAPVFLQFQVHAATKDSCCLKNGIIEFHVLKGMQGIVVYEVLQSLL